MPLTHPIVPNAVYFITQVNFNRNPIFSDPNATRLFLDCLGATKTRHPFRMRGYVILPDHMHLMLAPHDGSRIDLIMRSVKAVFTREYKRSLGLQGKIIIWQAGFMDHIIRNEEDFERHLNYLHYDPVKHGYAARPEDWPNSSFGYWKERGHYPDGWGCSLASGLFDLDWRDTNVEFE